MNTMNIMTARFHLSNEWYIIKRIEFSYERGPQQEWYNGEIYYARHYSPNYPLPDYTQVPHDALDGLIIEAVQKRFKDIRVNTSDQIFDEVQQENKADFIKSGGTERNLEVIITIMGEDTEAPKAIEMERMNMKLAVTTFPKNIDVKDFCYRTHKSGKEMQQLESLKEDTFVSYQSAIKLYEENIDQQ